jgi:hypothetical protein
MSKEELFDKISWACVTGGQSVRTPRIIEVAKEIVEIAIEFSDQSNSQLIKENEELQSDVDGANRLIQTYQNEATQNLIV